MKITITALFEASESARLAASALSMAQGGSLGLTVVTRTPGRGISSSHSPFAAAVGPQECGVTSGEAMITVTCQPCDEAFVMGELAALGARKVTQTCRE